MDIIEVTKRHKRKTLFAVDFALYVRDMPCSFLTSNNVLQGLQRRNVRFTPQTYQCLGDNELV